MSRLTITLASAALLAGLAVPASASATSNNNCLNGNYWESYTATVNHGTGTIATKNGAPLCQTTTITFESFTMPDTWNGQDFNQTALPQTKFASTSFTIPAGQSDFSKTVTIAVPAACKNSQLDFYMGNGYNKLVGLHDDDSTYIAGRIFKGAGACTATPTPTPVVTPKATPTPVAPKPTPAISTPAPTPAVLGTSTSNLPDTGAEGLVGAFGLTAMVGTAGLYIKQRLNRQ